MEKVQDNTLRNLFFAIFGVYLLVLFLTSISML